MHSIFNPTDAQNLIKRVESLTTENKPQWGKMEVSQMVKHCTSPIQVAFNEVELKIPFIFRMLGRLMKNKIIHGGEFKKNSPTAKEFIFKETFDLDTVKKDLIKQISRIAEGYQNVTCHNHPFYGKMNEKDWGVLLHKHTDYHLKQFGA